MVGASRAQTPQLQIFSVVCAFLWCFGGFGDAELLSPQLVVGAWYKKTKSKSTAMTPNTLFSLLSRGPPTLSSDGRDPNNTTWMDILLHHEITYTPTISFNAAITLDGVPLQLNDYPLLHNDLADPQQFTQETSYSVLGRQMASSYNLFFDWLILHRPNGLVIGNTTYLYQLRLIGDRSSTRYATTVLLPLLPSTFATKTGRIQKERERSRNFTWTSMKRNTF